MDGFTLRHLSLAVALSTCMGTAFAATSNDFVDSAAAGGIAEVETSRLALEKSSSADIKAFANMMITDPKGLAKHYVPESPEVLVYTDMTNPKESFTIHFTAPKEKGDYPYLCTFPGHWMVMNGVMKVE